ncbi:uncharacterized protein [Triticum aestivum]|uniref:uncharacterized protein n=1 Tax=Triticum aestivum TaxID=4565 RepID=UPI001D01B437|nr:uncharacterized protein LOC123133223 [Triticum aestivum]
MSGQGSDEVTSPLEDDDLLSEILLRLPTLPSSLPRASLVCKRWQRLATDAIFLRLFRGRHLKPPMLGAFSKASVAGEIVFTPLLDPPDRIPTERFSLRVCGEDAPDVCHVFGSHHGHVLVINWRTLELAVFDPVSGDRRTIVIPPECGDSGLIIDNGTVLCLCAARNYQGHVHGDCHSRPLKVVLVGRDKTVHPQAAFARVYSSETGMWGDIISSAEPCTGALSRHPCTFIGSALYWRLIGGGDGILEFDLDNQSLTVIDWPTDDPVLTNSCTIRGEDGGVGVALLLYPNLEMWDRKVNHRGVATWVLRKTTDMTGMLGPESANAYIVGYDEDADAVFMLILIDGDPCSPFLIIVQLESMKVKEYYGSSIAENYYYSFRSFHTAGTPHSDVVQGARDAAPMPQLQKAGAGGVQRPVLTGDAQATNSLLVVNDNVEAGRGEARRRRRWGWGWTCHYRKTARCQVLTCKPNVKTRVLSLHQPKPSTDWRKHGKK